MGYYTKNGGRIGSGSITAVEGVTDVVTHGLFGSKGIYQDILDLASTLSGETVPTPSNLGSIQSTIESANSAFNVFALVGVNGYAEQCAGTGVAGGKRTHTAKGFNYNTSSSNIISTGNDIVNMEGGVSEGLEEIDGKKWMAMAQFDGTNFDGILVWVFTGDGVNNGGTVSTGTRSVTNVRDIFYPVGASSSDYHHFYPIAIDATGNVTSSTTSGDHGWNFSNGSGAQSATGYNSTSRLSSDDGQWGFVINGQGSSSYTDGNGGGTIFTTNGYGMGNQNSGDSSNDCYWNGSNSGSNDQLGFVFSGDA